MPVNSGGVDYYLFSGLRVTTADNNDVDNAALTFAALGQGPTTGATLTAYDVATLNPTVPTTNTEGIPPRFRLTVAEADASADGGVTWFSVATVEQAELRNALLADVSVLTGRVDAAEASGAELLAQATAAQTAASEAAATVEGFNARLTKTEQDTAAVPGLVEDSQAALEQVSSVVGAVQEHAQRLDAIDQAIANGTIGGGSATPNHLWAMSYDGSVWEFADLAAAEAAGYLPGKLAVAVGLAELPAWATSAGPWLHATSANLA